MIRALPARALTLSRIAALGPFLWLLLRAPQDPAAARWLAVLYVFVAFSDYVDGPVARALGTASPSWGRIDVAADVSFNLASLAVAAALGWVGPWVPAVIALLAGRFLVRTLRSGAGRLPEDRAGKLAGVAFYALVGIVVLGAAGVVPAAVVARAGDVVFLYALFALWSGRRGAVTPPAEAPPAGGERRGPSTPSAGRGDRGFRSRA